jgi:hypothetical protein
VRAGARHGGQGTEARLAEKEMLSTQGGIVWPWRSLARITRLGFDPLHRRCCAAPYLIAHLATIAVTRARRAWYDVDDSKVGCESYHLGQRMISGLFRRPDPVWVARSKLAYWLHKARVTVSLGLVLALISWDIFYVYFSSGSRQEIDRIVCADGWNLAFLFPGTFSRLYTYQCSIGGGEPTISLVILLAKLAVATASGMLSTILFAILLTVQPPAGKLNAFVDRERKKKNFKWKVVGLLCLYFIIWPLFPIGGTLMLLNKPLFFKASFYSEFVCSGFAFFLYLPISTILFAAVAARLVLRGRSYLDLPPGL